MDVVGFEQLLDGRASVVVELEVNFINLSQQVRVLLQNWVVLTQMTFVLQSNQDLAVELQYLFSMSLVQRLGVTLLLLID